MPDQLNKQAIVNLLIDSPLREPIKINLIDIVNNTTEPDLPKVFPTITKELEIFQKATERRMKLAEETIAKLSGQPGSTSDAAAPSMPDFSAPSSPTETSSAPMTPPAPALSVPPLDLPPMPTSPLSSTPPEETPAPTPSSLPPMPAAPSTDESVSAAPSMPTMDTTPLPAPAPLGGATPAPQADEDALAEIQKELDSLKNSVTQDVAPVAAPPANTVPVQQ